MIDEIKQIKIMEIQKRLSEVETLKRKMEEAEGEIDRLGQSLMPVRRYSWLQRIFTKRKEYRELQESRKIVEQDIATKKEHYKELKDKFYADNQNGNSYGLKRQLSEIAEAKTLEELEMNFNTAADFLKQHGMPIVLTPQDRYIREPVTYYEMYNPRGRKREIKGIEDLICVHKTKFAPNDSRIKSSKEVGATVNSEIQINGRTYNYSYLAPRNTVHFSVNDEVASHGYGQWDDTKYAILIPFKDIPRGQIKQAASMDTYTEGGVNLTENSWIICPKDEIDEVQQRNPNVHVIGYEGENVSKYSPALISALGYKAESVGMWAWLDEKDQAKYNEIMEKEGLTMTPHSFSEDKENEVKLAAMNKAIAIFRTIKQNNLVKNLEDIEKILEEVEKMSYPSFESLMFTAIGYDMNNLSELISNARSNGLSISEGMRASLKRFENQKFEERLPDDIDMLIDKRQLSPRESAFLEKTLQGRQENTLGSVISKLLAYTVLEGIQREYERKDKSQEIENEEDKIK